MDRRGLASSEYRKERRFAWKPRRLSDGSWIWLKPYWVRLPVYSGFE